MKTPYQWLKEDKFKIPTGVSYNDPNLTMRQCAQYIGEYIRYKKHLGKDYHGNDMCPYCDYEDSLGIIVKTIKCGKCIIKESPTN